MRPSAILQGKKTRSLGQYRKANAAYTLYTTSEDYTKFVQRALLGGEGLKKRNTPASANETR